MISTFQTIIDEFSPLSEKAKKDATFLEISGYPHYENVCSNILEFFFDSQREHGLDDLVISSLLHCVSLDLKLSEIQVEREVQSNNGRIDIVIQSDTHVIAIENKIFHTINNPLDDYKSKTEKIADGRQCIYIVLGLRKEPLENKDFISVSYAELFSKIKEKIGSHMQASQNKYLIFLTEFMTSIENIMRGSIMDKDMIEFFSKNENEVLELVNEFKSVKKKLRTKVKNVGDCLNIDKGNFLRHGLYRELHLLADCIHHDIDLDEQKIAIDCYIRLSGWEITIFPRDGYSKEKLKESLEKRKIDVNYEGGRPEYNKYPFDHPKKEISQDLENLIKQLLVELPAK